MHVLYLAGIIFMNRPTYLYLCSLVINRCGQWLYRPVWLVVNVKRSCIQPNTMEKANGRAFTYFLNVKSYVFVQIRDSNIA